MATISVSAVPGADYQQTAFEAMLPNMTRQCSYLLRHVRSQDRPEAIADALAAAWSAWASMARKGVKNPADVTAAAYSHWACKYVRRGSKVGHKGGGRGSKDIFRMPGQFKAIPFSELTDAYSTCTRDRIPDIVACKLDFEAWLATRSPRDARVCAALASGATTKETAKRFQVSEPRISQIRSESRASLEAYLQS
jgi:hypothetical protein